MSKLELTNQSFKEVLTKDSIKISKQEQLILTQKDAIELGLLELDKLKKIKSQVKIESQVRIDSVFLPFTDSIYITVKDTSFLSRKFSISKKHYSINGSTLNKGIQIDSLFIFNDVKITLGNERLGIFKKNIPIVKVENSNPYIKTINMNNIVIKDEKKIYQRNSFWAGIGFIVGFIIK